MKKITLEDLKSINGGADKKSAKVKHNEVWKSNAGNEFKGGERHTETLSPKALARPRSLRK